MYKMNCLRLALFYDYIFVVKLKVNFNFLFQLFDFFPFL